MPDPTLNRTITQIAIEQAAIGQTDLVAAPGAGLNIYVVGFVLALSAAGTVTFNQGTGPSAISGVIPVAANGLILSGGDSSHVLLQTTTAGVKLGIVTVGTGATAHGWLRYFIAP